MVEERAVTTNQFIILSCLALGLMTLSFFYSMIELRKTRSDLREIEDEMYDKIKQSYAEGYRDGRRHDDDITSNIG